MKDAYKYKVFVISLFVLAFTIIFLSVQKCSGQIAADKSLHGGAGIFCGAWGTWVGSIYFEDSPEYAALIGLGVAAMAGLGKEGLDAGTGGSPELKDLMATITGGLIGAGLMYLGMKIYQNNVLYVGWQGAGSSGLRAQSSGQRAKSEELNVLTIGIKLKFRI